MKKTKKTIFALALISALALSSCLREEPGIDYNTNKPGKIMLSGEISQIYQTRVNDEGFCDGDAIGIYIVDYDGSTPGTLKTEGNRADNIKHTYDEENYMWVAAKDIYWKDDKTPVDVFGYYPYASPQSISAYSFELQKDQSTSAAYGKIGGYEASDLLWGKAEKIAPTDKVIRISFSHKMANVRITLAEGTGFTTGEWSAIDKAALVLNTKRSSTVDLSTGVVTATGEVPSTGTIPMKDNGDFRAIVVPQEVPAGRPLISVTVGGTPYLLTKAEPFIYHPSKQHNFTITVNKRELGGVEFVLTSESITAWENDNTTHDAAAREYIVIDVPTAGTLHERIAAAGKDLAKVKNMKVTGKINATDFAYMRLRMPMLQSLNLKEVTLVKGDGIAMDDTWYNGNEDNEIPDYAFYKKSSLQRLVLPDMVEIIGEWAFYNCSNLLGSIILPEGLTKISSFAFGECKSLNGVLLLPSSLEYIGEYAFYQCGFNTELTLPQGLKYIGNSAFTRIVGLRGSLILPESLEYIGLTAFWGNTNLTGSLEIPPKITEIHESSFSNCGFNGTLILNDDITSIGEYAFSSTPFRGELKLPENLVYIKRGAFSDCDFTGILKLPESISTIGEGAFYGNWRLIGVVEFPRNIQSIGPSAFQNCWGIEGVIFNDGLETIGQYAFSNCHGIGRIVSKSTIPPYIAAGVFQGVAKDNFTVEVPESSVSQYQTAVGWADFKRISAYRELSVSPGSASAINTSVTRDLILRAEGNWIVESKPDWVTLDKMSGNKIAEIKLTFQQMSSGSANREGEVVFKLSDKDYRTRFKVSQYNYEYAEDHFLTLHSATKGNGVNIVFLGDGYSAKDISEGKYLTTINEAVGHLFSVEPYKTYKEYFNVYTGIAVSPESGIGSVNTIINNRFNTYALGGGVLGPNTTMCPGCDLSVLEYAAKAPTVNESNIAKTLVVMIANSSEYGGVTYMYPDGSAIAYSPVSNYGYPYDFRGLVQHEAGGHGFGKLADEYISHNAFIHSCGCACHPHVGEILKAKNLGWYENISLSGKLNEVPWSHFIFHEKYNQIVDVFEGAFYHSRGVYRSEQTSCMNNNIPYFNAISRESIVKRIMAYAGETYSLSDFLAKDVLEASVPTKGLEAPELLRRAPLHSHAPIMMGKRPKLNTRK
ncbi:MAG: hypothetical protein BGO30_02720 [Bacteroidetes bacterium 41-46]|nr:MAG: hypothetical protein BGO30_02720 [Bacteroidetes bacterium 41-46]